MNTQLVIQPITFPYSGTGSQESAIKSAIEQSCKIAEGAIKRNNGDLILPGGKQTVPYQYWITDRNTFVFTPGCIVYRDREGNLHHTRICYAAALFVTPEPTSLETCQDQSAD